MPALAKLARRLRSNPLRFVLVLLQLGLAALVVTVAVSAYLSASAGPPERFGIDVLARGDVVAVTADVFHARHGPELLEMAPAVERIATHKYSSIRPKVEVAGERFMLPHLATVSPGFFDILGVEATRGALFTQAEAERGERLMVLSDDAAEILFGGSDPIGAEVTVLPASRFVGQPQTYRVTGTYRSGAHAGSARAFELLPGYMLAPQRARDGGTILVALAKPGEGAEAREQLLAAVRGRYRNAIPNAQDAGAYEFNVFEPHSSRDPLARADTPLLVFSLFGVIALIVSGIGVFATTVVEVTERTRDIGVQRALGATSRRIGLEFALEAGLMALAGGVLGALAAALLLPTLQDALGGDLFGNAELVFDPLVAAAVVAALVGLSALLAWLPAKRAGGLRPVEALAEAS